MKAKELKALLKDVDDNMEILIPNSRYFDGFLLPPCTELSGVSEICVNEQLDLTGNRFLLVPHGYFDEENSEISMN